MGKKIYFLRFHLRQQGLHIRIIHTLLVAGVASCYTGWSIYFTQPHARDLESRQKENKLSGYLMNSNSSWGVPKK